jgi:hypothetical protein
MVTPNDTNGISLVVIGAVVRAWSRWGLPYLIRRTRERYVEQGRDTSRIDAGLTSPGRSQRWDKTAVSLAGAVAIVWGIVLIV